MKTKRERLAEWYRHERESAIAAKVAESLEDPRPVLTPFDFAAKVWSTQIAAEIAKASLFTRVHDDQPDALRHVLTPV